MSCVFIAQSQVHYNQVLTIKKLICCIQFTPTHDKQMLKEKISSVLSG